LAAQVCVLLVAYLLRLAGLTSESLWIDEGYSFALAGHSVPEIVQGAAVSQHPPLYYLVLWAWLLMGRTAYHLRYLSAFLGTLGVAAGSWVGRKLLGKRVGLAAGLLLACSPTHIWYSQEARMYVLLALLVTLSAGLTWQLLRTRRGWLLYAACTALALYTHYFSLFVILAESLYVAVWAVRQPKSTRRWWAVRWLGVQAAVVLAFSPWLPVAVKQARSHRMSWVAPVTWAKVGGTPLLLVLGEAGLGALGVLIMAGLGLALAWLLWREWQDGRRAKLWRYGYSLAWFGVPYFTVALLSLARPVFQSKQMLIVLTPLVILLGAALVRLPRFGQVVVAGALVWVMVSSLHTMYSEETKDGWREVGVLVQQHHRAGDVLYLNPAAGILTLEVYLSDSLEYDGYPFGYDLRTGGWRGEPVTRTIAEREMSGLATQFERVWLIEFGPEFWDPEGHIAEWLEGHGDRALERSFGRVAVRLYDLSRRT
jgi:uncharacterized membrane protein